jgi:XTP/dITP diphosphohydrolase
MLTIATHNRNKFKEIADILSPIECQDCSHLQMAQVEETGLSFIENALIKARNFSKLANIPCIGDDSGLVVPALGGRPGIYSARFSGLNATDEKNRLHLLACMKNIPNDARHAYFYCAVVYVQHSQDPTPIIALGQWHGAILHEERGEHGFGYDSVFFVPSHQCSAGELSPQEKNRISHRAQALSSLKKQLRLADDEN